MSENRPKPYLGNPQETIAVLNRYKFARKESLLRARLQTVLGLQDL